MPMEHRDTFKLLSYWNRIKGRRGMPALSDVQVGEISDIWPMCLIINLEAIPCVEYFGPDLAEIVGFDLTEETLENMMREHAVLQRLLHFYPRVLELKAPISESSSWPVGSKENRYRSLIVPLSDDGHTVTHLLGTTNYRRY